MGGRHYRFNMKPIIGTAVPLKSLKQRSKAVRDQKIRVDKSFFILCVPTQHLQTIMFKSK